MTTQQPAFIVKSLEACVGRCLRLALPLAFLLQAAACASTPVEYPEKATSPPPEAKVVLGPGDEIELKFPYWQELNDTQIIRPDGFITLQLIDAVQTQGLTPEELDEKLTQLYAPKIKDPVISVVVRTLVNQRIYVGGEVNTPGLLSLQGEVDALQAVLNAGGFKETAQVGHVIVIRKDQRNRAVPYKINLSGSLHESAPQETFFLRPNDVVYVPKTVIANLDKFVNQYISQLFLFRGIGLGFNYNLINDNNDTFVGIN
jgi:protein involved in polysaccharide export with SLBB domain